MDRYFLVFIDCFLDSILVNVIVMHAFSVGCVAPDDGSLVVVENWSQQRREQIKVVK